MDYWETKLRAEASLLPSLGFFKPSFMSLKFPHKLWTSTGNKIYEVSKARIQLLFLSSQYPCGKLTWHWSASNPEGFCTFPQCFEAKVLESPEHVLLNCPAYFDARSRMVDMFLGAQHPATSDLVRSFLISSTISE